MRKRIKRARFPERIKKKGSERRSDARYRDCELETLVSTREKVAGLPAYQNKRIRELKFSFEIQVAIFTRVRASGRRSVSLSPKTRQLIYARAVRIARPDPPSVLLSKARSRGASIIRAERRSFRVPFGHCGNVAERLVLPPRPEARLESALEGRRVHAEIFIARAVPGDHRATATNYYGGENADRWCVISARRSPAVCVQDREYRRCRSLPSRQRPATCPSTLP